MLLKDQWQDLKQQKGNGIDLSTVSVQPEWFRYRACFLDVVKDEEVNSLTLLYHLCLVLYDLS